MTTLQQRISSQFAHLDPQFDFLLAPLTYMKIGGPAEVFLELKSREALIEVVQFCHQQGVPFTMLGGASNVIVSSDGIPGLTLQYVGEQYQKEPVAQADGRFTVRASAGLRTGIFVRKTVDDGLKGLEYFLGVPGRLGGAIYNNAHYLSDLIGEHIERVEVVNQQGEVVWMTKEECHFGYDYSIFHERKDVIIQAEFALFPGNKEESLQLIKKATEYRAKTQPLGEPSSGCYFRNTPNNSELKRLFPQYAERKEFPSAFLIDQAGLKGATVGGVKVSEKHAAFFINMGSGTSQELQQLAQQVKERVFGQFGVQLEEEVFFLPKKG